MTDLINRFDKLMNKYEELHLELVVSKNVNKLLKNRVMQLEKVCDALSLTGILVKQEDFYAFHMMKDQSKVIIKFKDRKQKYCYA